MLFCLQLFGVQSFVGPVVGFSCKLVLRRWLRKASCPVFLSNSKVYVCIYLLYAMVLRSLEKFMQSRTLVIPYSNPPPREFPWEIFSPKIRNVVDFWNPPEGGGGVYCRYWLSLSRTYPTVIYSRGKELAAPQAWDKENFFWLTGSQERKKKRGGQRSKSTKKNERRGRNSTRRESLAKAQTKGIFFWFTVARKKKNV